MRAQTTLPALAIAFLLLTAALVATVTAAESALDDAERPALDRQAAVALSDRLVRDGAPLTTRPNVLDGSRLPALTAERLRARYGLAEGVGVRVRLGDRTLVEAGTPEGGVSVERLVLVERRQERTVTPSLGWSRRVRLPRRTPRVRLRIRPPPNATVRAVRVDGRVRLRNASGLRGTFEVPVSTRQTPTIGFDASGPLPERSVSVWYYPAQTEKARLEVTVDG